MYWRRSPELAADLMAETFAEAFESMPRYDQQSLVSRGMAVRIRAERAVEKRQAGTG